MGGRRLLAVGAAIACLGAWIAPGTAGAASAKAHVVSGGSGAGATPMVKACAEPAPGFATCFARVSPALAAPAPMVSVRVFDRYAGKGVPNGRVSLSLRLTLQAAERTLTDAEVQQSVEMILAALVHEHGAVLR